MKKLLTVAGMAALLAGCYSARNDYPSASGSSTADQYTYRGQYGTLGPSAAQTNYFGPVNEGPESALGPSTPSGGTLRETR